MPLTVNVGISRKASANYQSAGLSINLTAELDQSLPSPGGPVRQPHGPQPASRTPRSAESVSPSPLMSPAAVPHELSRTPRSLESR